MKRIYTAGFVSLGVLILLIVVSCAVNPVTGRKQLMFISESQELAMGQQYDPEIVSAFGEYRDDEMLKFLQEKTNEMGKLSHRSSLQYHVKILDSPVVNAFAVPGGYIYLTRGILAQLNNEAEVVGVIGHEMGHITARHSVSQQSKQQIGQLILIGGLIVSEKVREYADYAMAGLQLLFLSYSREDERQADYLGVEYSSKIGYDAHKMADFFQVLHKMNLESQQGGVPTFLSTHPDPGDRYNAVNEHATEWQQNLAFDSWKVNADNYLEMIDGMVYGEDPRQGFTEGNTFYHPDLQFRFSFPAGWQLENTPVQVTMAPESGNALLIFTLTSGENLESAAQNTISQLQLSVQDYQTTTVNGMPAMVVLSSQTSQDESTGQQQTISVLSYFIEYNKMYYVFHGVSTQAEFPSYYNNLEATMKNFSRLTDPAKLNVKPDKLIVRRVQRESTLADAFRSFGIPQNMMNELALLNNMELTDRVPAGKLLKTVGQ